MFKVVTVSREYGSGGAAIARLVAEKLGWKLLDREIIETVASTAHVDAETATRYDEHVDPWWRRFHREGLRSMAVEAGITPGDAQFFDAKAMAEMSKEVMRNAATTGECVIVGRGAQCALQDRDEVLHVFIYAPWETRMQRVRDRMGDRRDLEDLIRSTDQERGSYVRTYYGCDWLDPHLYDMMLSSKFGTEAAASIIVNAVLENGQD
jgi:cytidylate kinase